MKYKTIGDYCEGRKNNLDFIRFVAATMVLFSHSFPLSSGVQLEDPLARFTHFINFGALGVYIFFAISGFLVTKSYCARHDLLNFIKARCLRIFPGLILAMLFSALVLGVISTTLPLSEYLHNADTYQYVLHNTFLYKIRYNLPGVFLNNPYPVAVNGSLWTLPVEFKMYILVALTGAAGLLKNRKYFNIVVAGTIIGFVLLNIYGANFIDPSSKTMILYFVLGAVFYLNRNSIPLNPVILGIICLLAILLFKTFVFKYVFIIALTYLIFFLAYYPFLKLNNFGKYGDFSYGMYIYAFPTQQFIAMNRKGISPMVLFVGAFFITLVLSILSWRLIEAPAMKLKNKRLFSFFRGKGDLA